MKFTTHLLVSSALSLLLVGCGEFHNAAKQEKDLLNKSDNSHVPQVGEGLITVSDKPYLVGETIAAADDVPEILRAFSGLSLSRPISLQDAVAQASMQTGIPARVLADAEDTDTESGGAGLPFNGVTLPPPPSNASKSSRHSSVGGNGRGVWFEYHGSRAGLFGALASRFGVSQRWTGHKIEFFRNITKTYIIPAFDGESSDITSVMAVTGGGNGSSSSGGMGGGMSGGMGGGGGMGSSSGSGSSSSGSQGMAGVYERITTKRWEHLEKTALQVGDGARVVADPGLGTLTATGTPEQLASLDGWYDGLKKMLTRQVAVTIHVFSVKLDRESNYGFSPEIAAKRFGQYFAATTTPTAIPNIQSQDVPFSFGASILKGKMSGTNLAVQALQSLDNVTELYERGVITTNGVSAPFQHGTNTTYIQNASSYLATNAGSSASISPGVVMSGFEGSVTPRVIDDDILLNIHFLIQTLLSLDNLSGNNSVSIQGPKTNGTTVTDKVVLHDGETLVLSGFVGDSTQRQQNGVGSPFNWIFGGGGDASNTKDRVLITVEAHTL